MLDFYCEERRVAIEIDGGYHRDPEQRERDVERQTLLEDAGIRFIRIPAEVIEDDAVAAMRLLIAALSALR